MLTALELGRAFVNGETGIFRECPRGIEGEDKPAFHGEEDDGAGLELRSDNAFRRQPQTVPVEGQRYFEIPHAKREDVDGGFHRRCSFC